MGRRIRLIVVIAGAAAALTLGIRSWRAGTVPVTAATVHAGPLEVWITTNGVVEPTDPDRQRRVRRAVPPILRARGVEAAPLKARLVS